MSKNWSSYSTSQSLDSKKGVANHHFSKHLKPKEKHSSISTTECFFCENWTSNNPHFIQNVINKALYLKNFSLQKFFYTKDINDILAGKKNAKTINFKDMQCFYYEIEHLKQIYPLSEYDMRIKKLGEYYKFHQDIPRMFIKSTSKIFSYYHDNKRRIDYYRISKMLREQNKSRNASPDNNAPVETKHQNSTIADKILVDLDDPTQIDSRKSSKTLSPINFKDKTSDFYGKAVLTTNPLKTSLNRWDDKEKSNCYKKPYVTKVDVIEDTYGGNSLSKSIIELNKKLGEIINQSHSQSLNLDIMSYYIDQSHRQLGEKAAAPEQLVSLVEETTKTCKKQSPTNKAQEKKAAMTEYYSDKPAPNNQEFDSVKLIYEDQNSNTLQVVSSATNQQAFKSSEWFQSLKKVGNSSLIRKRPNRLICTSKERVANEMRKSMSSMKLSNESVIASQNYNHYSAATIAKIKNFEEVLKKKQAHVSTEVRIQRSLSRDKTYQHPNSSFSDQKNTTQQAAKTQREKSEDAHSSRGRKKIDILKTKIKLSGSNNLTYRDKRLNMFNKQSGTSLHQYESQNQGSDKDFYTSINIKELTQQVNQQGHRFMSNTAQNVKVTSKAQSGNNDEHFAKIPPKIPIYHSVKDYKKSQTLVTDPHAQPSAQTHDKKAENIRSTSKDALEAPLVSQGDLQNGTHDTYKTLVLDKATIRIRNSSNENLRKNKALTHRERDFEVVLSREASSEKNKKLTKYILTKKDDNGRLKRGNRNSESPDSEEGKRLNEERALKHDKSSKDLVKFFVEHSQGKGREKPRRAISTEKFRPEMIASNSQHKLSGIAINSMRDHKEMNKDVNNIYEKIYTKYAQGLSLKSVPKEGFLKVKAKGEMNKDGKGVVNTRCVKVDLHSSKEVLHIHSIENDNILNEANDSGGQQNKLKRRRKNTLEICLA